MAGTELFSAGRLLLPGPRPTPGPAPSCLPVPCPPPAPGPTVRAPGPPALAGPRGLAATCWPRSQFRRCRPAAVSPRSSRSTLPSMSSIRTETRSAFVGSAYQICAPLVGFSPAKRRLVFPRLGSLRHRTTSSGLNRAICVERFSSLSCLSPETSQAHRLRPCVAATISPLVGCCATS